MVGGPRLARVLEGPGQTSARLIPSLVAAALRYSSASEFVGVRSRSPVFVKRSSDIFLRWGEKKIAFFFFLTRNNKANPMRETNRIEDENDQCEPGASLPRSSLDATIRKR